ncbi:hypothetical protein [Rummeliibacillus sp. BSL5]
MKIIKLFFLVTVVFATLMMSVGETASAAKTSTTIKMNSKFAYGGKAYLTTSENHSKVNATYEAAYDSYVYVKLSLQRYSKGKWKNLGTKSGYTTNGFENKKNLNVTFNNISNVTKKSTRIKVKIYNGYNKTQLMQTAYSKKWIR